LNSHVTGETFRVHCKGQLFSVGYLFSCGASNWFRIMASP